MAVPTATARPGLQRDPTKLAGAVAVSLDQGRVSDKVGCCLGRFKQSKQTLAGGTGPQSEPTLMTTAQHFRKNKPWHSPQGSRTFDNARPAPESGAFNNIRQQYDRRLTLLRWKLSRQHV